LHYASLGVEEQVETDENERKRRTPVRLFSPSLRLDAHHVVYRQGLEQAALVFYDIMARHMTNEEQPVQYAELARQFGLDLFDPAGNLVSGEESQQRVMSFLRHRIALGVRHRDGSRLTEPEIQSVLDQSGNSPFSQAWDAYWKQHENDFETQLLPLIVPMTGLYNAPFGPSDNPFFAFDLHLPGQVVESSGTIKGLDHVLWRFTGDRSFPDGYVMQARSFEIDLQGQKRILGRVAITDNEQAESYIEIRTRTAPCSRSSARCTHPAT
jgi:hypothetical protein